MNFRHFLEKHDIGENVLALVLINQKLKQVGLMLRQGIIINAPSLLPSVPLKINRVSVTPRCIRPVKGVSGISAYLSISLSLRLI